MSVTTRARRGARQQGFTLIEVLVSMIVLAIGLLGLAQLQARGLQFNQDAYVRSQATVLAYEIIDRMRANRDNAADYVSAHPGPGQACNPLSTAPDIELSCWHSQVAQALPGGEANITVQPNPDYYQIEISWLDRDTPDPADRTRQTWVTYP